MRLETYVIIKVAFMASVIGSLFAAYISLSTQGVCGLCMNLLAYGLGGTFAVFSWQITVDVIKLLRLRKIRKKREAQQPKPILI